MLLWTCHAELEPFRERCHARMKDVPVQSGTGLEKARGEDGLMVTGLA